MSAIIIQGKKKKDQTKPFSLHQRIHYNFSSCCNPEKAITWQPLQWHIRKNTQIDNTLSFYKQSAKIQTKKEKKSKEKS